MTSVVLNKIGLDIVDIQIDQSGAAETDMFFQDPVLDHTRDYVVGVSELSIPLSQEPMLSQIKTRHSEVFMEFRVKRLANGTMVELGSNNAEIGDNQARMYLSNYQISSPSDLLQALDQFVYTFERLIIAGGNPNSYQIKLLASPSGILRFRGSASFWKDFVIHLGEYGNAIQSGYAEQILGYNQDYIALVWKTGEVKPSTSMTDLIDTQGNDTWFASDDGLLTSAHEIAMEYTSTVPSVQFMHTFFIIALVFAFAFVVVVFKLIFVSLRFIVYREGKTTTLTFTVFILFNTFLDDHYQTK